MNGLIVVVFGVSLCLGCTHTQLRKNAVRQAGTLTDIYEQQVLDNLARFAHDPNVAPSFMYPTQGGQDVVDGADASSTTNWSKAGFASEALGFRAARSMKEAWVMTPVHDVRRLELMRCAYQHAMYCAGLHSTMSSCPDCDKLQRKFYLGSASGKYNKDDPSLDNLAYYSRSQGRTTPACFEQVCWLGYGDKSCVPKNCDCLKVGEYCGTYVWVLPCGQSELTKLTFTILDYALTPQAPSQSKKVTIFYDAQGHQIANRDNASFVEEFTTGGGPGVDDYVFNPKADAVRQELRQARESRAMLRLQMSQQQDNGAAKAVQSQQLQSMESQIDSLQNKLNAIERAQPRPAPETPPIHAPLQGPFNYQPLELQLYQDLLTPRF
ncbi:hypothetical protein C5Y96_11470 [Blastopirellula marina]|uniref:Uncharacterized protein n=2 Tax=Pirellulales TaxID=2691354 RepID=A0A2S8FMN6_9BACT|nr:hypothetical protein C5Y96_11470 [Blastopirellula marina]RCS52544.1 hypothetical protein DTL36_11480 [Bremerella cremea]